MSVRHMLPGLPPEGFDPEKDWTRYACGREGKASLGTRAWLRVTCVECRPLMEMEAHLYDRWITAGAPIPGYTDKEVKAQ